MSNLLTLVTTWETVYPSDARPRAALTAPTPETLDALWDCCQWADAKARELAWTKDTARIEFAAKNPTANVSVTETTPAWRQARKAAEAGWELFRALRERQA